ncbi:MAG: HAD family hydrolase [Prevotellaceae bacterium]|nr:HAD family hydrolase [Prevotellaceae bacterium]
MIRGIIFDYGGTLDTNSLHWSEVLWQGYQSAEVPVTEQQFRDSYVFAERELARHPYIKPEHNFLDLLRIKVDIETRNLVAVQAWAASEAIRAAKSEAIALYCYRFVLEVLKVSRPVVEELSRRYPLVLVSNFYGNIGAVLQDFSLQYFQSVIESSVVGVRKPDPQIFRLGVEALGFEPQEVVVVGDSFSKDIVPAHSLGCQTVWMRGKGWGEKEVDESLPTWILTDIAQLPSVFTHASQCELGK